jgi:hypothetical protein
VWEGIFKYDESCESCILRDYNVTSINQYGYERVTPTKGLPTGRLSRRGYWEIPYQGKLYKAHRIVWEIHNGEIPINMQIDHIDGDKNNNTISNLRVVSNKLNSRNSSLRKHNTSGITGVVVNKSKDGELKGFRAIWTELDGKQRNKSFSIVKYGKELAEFLASEYRKHQIDLLNIKGAGYTERHGGN